MLSSGRTRSFIMKYYDAKGVCDTGLGPPRIKVLYKSYCLMMVCFLYVTGILIVVALGVAIGVAIGVMMLVIVLAYMKR